MKKNNRTVARRARGSRHLPVRRDGGRRHTILTVFHVFIAFVFVGLILIHLGKGTDAGAAFGSGDRTPDIDGGRPVIGVGVKQVSSATDSRMDGYVPKTDYETLKREVETLKSQMQRLAAAATPQSKSAAAETQGQKKPVASAPPPSKESVGRSDQEEFEVANGDRRKEAEEAKRELDQFLRAQKLLFKPGEIQLEFGAFYAKEAETSQISPGFPVFISRFAQANVLMRYGLAEDLEFNFGVPLAYTEQEIDSRPFASSFTRKTGVGFGDISWAFRYAAIHEDRGLPEVTLNANVKADTGDEDRGLGTGHWNVGTGVSLVKTIDPVVFFGSLGYTSTLAQGDVDPGDQIPYSIGMGFSLNDRVSLSMTMAGAAIRRTEINGNEIGGSGLDINSLQFMTTVQLAKRMYVEPFVGFGLTDEAPDFLVGINVPVGLEGRFPLPFF
ncbi:MAG: preprotein translocase subunit SecG [Gammaproteobacteria bacterium]